MPRKKGPEGDGEETRGFHIHFPRRKKRQPDNALPQPESQPGKTRGKNNKKIIGTTNDYTAYSSTFQSARTS